MDPNLAEQDRKRLKIGIVLVFLTICNCILLMVPEGFSAKQDCQSPIVKTSSGSLCGLKLKENETGIFAYLGIPYADSTTGKNRFKPPVPYQQRKEILSTKEFGPICPQEKTDPPGPPQSEDCLSLNIWTPVTPGSTETIPTMVYIHGGSFLDGSSRNPVFDGKNMAAQGKVLVVTINYRLGALGFLAGTDGLPGNYGFLDQRLALRWVQENIKPFGGDPKKVTVFGESAGAMSVGLHLVTPESQGLFRAAIMESNPYGLPYKTVAQAKEFGDMLKKSLGCKGKDIACLRDANKIPAELIIEHQSSPLLEIKGMLEGFKGQLIWAPVVDGKLIPTQATQAKFNKPILIGTNRNEGVIFAVEEQMTIPFTKKKIVPKIKYELFLPFLFPLKKAAKIFEMKRYRPRFGDNTVPLSHLLTDYLFTCANQEVMNNALVPIFAYYFTHVPSFNVWPKDPLCAPKEDKVCHGAELPFVFGNPITLRTPKGTPRVPHQFTPAEKVLSNTMIAYWTHFAHHQSPQDPTLPDWPPYQKDQPIWLVLDEKITQKNNLNAHCDFWNTVGY